MKNPSELLYRGCQRLFYMKVRKAFDFDDPSDGQPLEVTITHYFEKGEPIRVPVDGEDVFNSGAEEVLYANRPYVKTFDKTIPAEGMMKRTMRYERKENVPE